VLLFSCYIIAIWLKLQKVLYYSFNYADKCISYKTRILSGAAGLTLLVLIVFLLCKSVINITI